MLAKNHALAAVVLKHNDGKTVKFIFRNLYFLLAIHVDCKTKEISLREADNHINREQLLSVVSFLTHLLLCSFSTTK